MSFDTPQDNAGFIQAEGFQYALWSDLERELALVYGAADSADQARADRRTVLLDAQGAAILRYSPGLSVGAHPQEVLEDCQALFGD